MTRNPAADKPPRHPRLVRGTGWLCVVVALAAAVATGLPCKAERGLTHTLQSEIGLGYDTNPFLTPDEPYFDQNRREIVDPVRQPGFFVPVNIDGGLVVPLSVRGHRFVTGYRAKGAFYTDDATGSADEVWIKVDPGFVFDLGFGSNRNRYVDVRAFASYNRELFFDRDTGLPATASGFDVSDRYNYQAVGVDLRFDYEFTKTFRLYLDSRLETRDYDDPGFVTPFDHDRLGAELGTVFRFSSKVRWYLTYAHQIRDYTARIARGSDGDDAIGNPTLRYLLDTVSTEIRYRPLRPWRLEFRYAYGTRTDTFANYNDYIESGIRVRSTVRQGRTQWRLTFQTRERDFTRAWIFDKPINPATGSLNPTKLFDRVDAMFEGYFPLNGRLRLFTQLRYIAEEATDPRFEYDRSRAMAGVEWAY